MSMRTLCLAAFLCVAALVPAADEKINGEGLLPESTIAAIVIPDLQSARDGWSKTRTAEMFAQPEMQAFLKPVLDQMNATYAELKATVPLLPALADLDKGLLSGEITIGVFAQNGRPGATLTIAPRDPAAFEKMLNDGFQALGPLQHNDILPMGRNDNEPGIVWTGKRFLACSSVVLLKETFKKLEAGAPAAGCLAANADYAASRAKIPNSSGWLYVRPASIAELVGPDKPQVHGVISGLGFEKNSSVLIGMGVADGEPILEGFSSLPPRAANGLSSLFGPGKPVNAAALKIAAADAPYVGAGSFNFGAFLPLIRGLLVDPAAMAMVDNGMIAINQRLGFDLQHDLLENLDTDIVNATTAMDTGMPMSLSPGMLTSIGLKDAAKVEACLKRLTETLQGHRNPIGLALQIKTIAYGGKTVYYVSSLLNGGISACISDNRLILANSLNALRRGIDQLAKGDDITTSKAFQQTIARLSGKPFDPANLPSGFAFSLDDSSGGGTLLLTGLGLASGTAMLAAMAEGANPGAAADGGFDPMSKLQAFMTRPAGQVIVGVGRTADLALWPDEGFFAKYRRARGSINIADKQGLYFRTELPPPTPGFRGGGAGPLMAVGVVSVGAGLALPVLARARESARRTSSASNMNQFGKACMLYADDPKNGDFPADPLDLIPNYIADPKVMKNPRFPDQASGYVYLSGVSINDDATTILLYENVPDAKGRNVLIIAGSVEFMPEEMFQEALQAAEDRVKERNGTLKQVPIDFNEARKRMK